MAQDVPQARELEELEKTLNSEVKAVNIRLREGEYQYSLAKAIASFELELRFPDVKDLVKKLFGEKKTEDPQFLSKIQTILKKMEKSGIVKILPKEKPWELQRYVLSCFKFQDVEKNDVVLATKPEIEKTRNLIHSRPNLDHKIVQRKKATNAKTILVTLAVIVSYVIILWTLIQPTVELTIFVPAFCIAIICSVILGVLLSRNR